MRTNARPRSRVTSSHIAVAPDLLAALKDAAGLLALKSYLDAMNTPQCHKVMETIQAAIAKAEGII